jgi:hypothetical protein
MPISRPKFESLTPANGECPSNENDALPVDSISIFSSAIGILLALEPSVMWFVD